MMELERFERDIMSKATYYETIGYVADYVQRFLDKIFEGGEIENPIPIDMLLGKLGVEVEYHSRVLEQMEHVAGNFEFYKDKKIISFSPYVNYKYCEWMKVKFLAKYLVYYEYSQDKEVYIFEYFWPKEQYVKRLDPYDGIVDMVAWQIMLPWKQNITKLKEITIPDYNDGAIYYSINNFSEVSAYYHLLRTIEAKEILGELSKKELQKVYKQIEDMCNEKPK